MVVAAALLAAMEAAQPAFAQAQKATHTQKVLVENERMRATETVYKPGEHNTLMKRGNRVTRILKGETTLTRTHADGKKVDTKVKEGMVWHSAPDESMLTNTGKGTVTLYTVTAK